MNQENYKKSREFVIKVNTFSNYKLKKIDDLTNIISLSYEYNLQKEIEEISFTAKYIQGLMRVMKSANENPEIPNIQNLKEDLTKNFEKIKEQLNIIISKDENTKFYFKKHFFEMTPESFKNLNDLLHDFEWIKIYSNEEKRSGIQD